ncbi:hypothetical protein AArcSl_1456 [Halalkaliarchaeum desulfuricum]|uniref:Uncharacterized protein n=1 Tax=Halalkaliarchaeum desulfuricum TaxID=2055893 RepID=A0A343TJ14_9EURY|nr:hypothetical protein AArcSl_1456 [Halalkaliarchaeum desulfuricum]
MFFESVVDFTDGFELFRSRPGSKVRSVQSERDWDLSTDEQAECLGDVRESAISVITRISDSRTA